jgi:acetate kinase
MTSETESVVLAFNPGSNSLKFEIIASEPIDRNRVRGRKLLSGFVEPIGPNAKFSLLDGRQKRGEEDFARHPYGRRAHDCARSGLLL